MREVPPVNGMHFVVWAILTLLFVLGGAVLAALAGGVHAVAFGTTMLLTTSSLFAPTAILMRASEV
jgi:hypothetical protein